MAVLGGLSSTASQQAAYETVDMQKVAYAALFSGVFELGNRFFSGAFKQSIGKIEGSTKFSNAAFEFEDAAGTGTSSADFYVKPNGDVVPATGYRYSNSTILATAEQGYIPAKQGGMYFSFDRIDQAVQAKSMLQIPYYPEYRIGFDILGIIDDVYIPQGNWGMASYLEPIARDFPQFGIGGATQAITYSEIFDVVSIFQLK